MKSGFGRWSLVGQARIRINGRQLGHERFFGGNWLQLKLKRKKSNAEVKNGNGCRGPGVAWQSKADRAEIHAVLHHTNLGCSFPRTGLPEAVAAASDEGSLQTIHSPLSSIGANSIQITSLCSMENDQTKAKCQAYSLGRKPCQQVSDTGSD